MVSFWMAYSCVMVSNTGKDSLVAPRNLIHEIYQWDWKTLKIFCLKNFPQYGIVEDCNNCIGSLRVTLIHKKLLTVATTPLYSLTTGIVV